MPEAVFTIPLPMPLVSDNSRASWRGLYAKRTTVREFVYLNALSERNRLGLGPAKERRHVHLTLLRGPRQQLLDPSNVDSYLKPALDALTTPNGRSPLGSAWLVDDNAKWCEYHRTTQEIDRKNGPAVRVHIWWNDEG